MCEIFFAMAMESPTLGDEVVERLLLQAIDSARTNDDGWGIFNEKRKVAKSPKQFKYKIISHLVREFKDSKFVVLHLRSATKGSVCVKNTHPFVKDNWIMVHNGVCYIDDSDLPILSEEQKKDISDSEEMLLCITNQSENNVTNTIKEALKKVGGSFSCFLYGPDNRLYYFRETSGFTFGLNTEKGILLGATGGSEKLKSMFRTARWGIVVDSPTVFTNQPSERELYEFDSERGLVTHGSFQVKTSGGHYQWYGHQNSGRHGFGYNESLRSDGYYQTWQDKPRCSCSEEPCRQHHTIMEPDECLTCQCCHEKEQKKVEEFEAKQPKCEHDVMLSKPCEECNEHTETAPKSGIRLDDSGNTSMEWRKAIDDDIILKVYFNKDGKFEPRTISWDLFWASLRMDEQEEVLAELNNDSSFITDTEDEDKCSRHKIPPLEFNVSMAMTHSGYLDMMDLCPICVGEWFKVYYGDKTKNKDKPKRKIHCPYYGETGKGSIACSEVFQLVWKDKEHTGQMMACTKHATKYNLDPYTGEVSKGDPDPDLMGYM